MTNKKKKPKPKLSSGNRPVVFVKWTDHCSTSRIGWQHVDGMDMDAVECESVGFKVFEDDDVLVLAISQDANGKINDTMHIIKSCITKRRVLT